MSPPPPKPGQLPARMPHFRDHPGRALCRALLRLAGWQLEGSFPDCERLVLIAAPHSSWWDGIWGLVFKVAIGADVHYMIKAELVRGPFGWLLRTLGAIGIHRDAARGVVEQMVDQFAKSDPLWLAITPEGTRKPVKRWKSGFWHIARRSGVPVLPVAFHYPARTIVLGPLFQTSRHVHEDIERLRAFYAPYQGKHHGI